MSGRMSHYRAVFLGGLSSWSEEQRKEVRFEMARARAAEEVLTAERDSAVADNTALLGSIQTMRNLLMYPHDEWHQVAADAIRAGNEAVKTDHPGADLLKRMQQQAETIKALADALDRFGRHKSGCLTKKHPGCRCGLVVALRLAGRTP